MRDTLAGAIRLLSVLPGEPPGAIDRLLTDGRDQQRTMTALRQDRRPTAPRKWLRRGPSAAGRLVLRVVEGDANDLRSLGIGHRLQTGLCRRASRPHAPRCRRRTVAGRCVPGRTTWSKALTATFGGRGGGKPELAQAGGLDAQAGRDPGGSRAEVTSVAGLFERNAASNAPRLSTIRLSARWPVDRLRVRSALFRRYWRSCSSALPTRRPRRAIPFVDPEASFSSKTRPRTLSCRSRRR